MKRSTTVAVVAIQIVILAILSGRVMGQESRGSITGKVTDPSGAAVPGAQLSVTDAATNVTTKARTDAAGDYYVPYLIPGVYNVSVEAPGFKKLIRPRIEVRVADQLTLDLRLEIGAAQQEVTVTAESPLLEAATASAGMVIDGRRISELPLSDGNPFTLERLAPGVSNTNTGTNLQFSRPFDNGGTSAIRVDGVSGGNEYTLDGSPNMASGNRVAFIPPADAVQEFKLETTHYDAQHAHTGGADVNVMLKSGTNQLHGTLYEFVRNDLLNANDFFANSLPKPCTAAQGGPNCKSATRYNRYGGSVGGPVWVPKLYNGRDKTFFFFAYEALPDVFPEPNFFTVPTAAERNGDFSALPSTITIYDPLTATQTSGGHVSRMPIRCNGQINVICPDRLSPIAQNFLKFYPLPNVAGNSQGQNNFFSKQPRSDHFNSETVRIDENLSQKQKFFFTFTRNWRREFRGNWTGLQNGVLPTGNYLFRINHGGTYDHVYTFSPTTLLDARVGFSRFVESNVRPSQGLFDPTTLGFSSQTASFFNGANYLPYFNITDFSKVGDNLGSVTTFNIYSFQPTLTKLLGAHTLRMGYDFRSYRENSTNPGALAGQYDFNNNFTKQLDTGNGQFGQGLAAFLLGQPTGGMMDRNASRANQTLYNGVWFQDDWKVSPRLTLNLGLRYDIEGGTTERFNRLNRGFDFTSPSPIEAMARAAYAGFYATNPSLPITPDNFHVRGGLLFADPQHRGYWDADSKAIQPRIGAAYRINQKTVLRGGWAIFTIPIIIDQRQDGFSQSTPVVPTNDNGLHFQANLLNPFPNGVANPPGASLGLATFMGKSITFHSVDRKNGRSQRWSFGVQRELPGAWLVDVAYVGEYGYDMGEDTNILNAVPRQYLSTSPTRGTCYSMNPDIPAGCSDDPANVFLSFNFTNQNPFFGLIPGQSLGTSNQISQSQLLRPFPQFTSPITSQRDDGTNIYHSAQVRVEKRFSHGFTLNGSYTWSKILEKVSFLNDSDTEYEKRVSGQDLPHSGSISGIWELPFGRGRRLGSSWHGATDEVLGGWQVGGLFTKQSGFPIGMGNRLYFGDPTQLRTHISGNTVNQAFDTSGFYFSDAPVQTNGVVDPAKQIKDQRIHLTNNIRTFPSNLSGFRGQGTNNWDLSVIKNFSLTERAKLQFRGEFLNAFNHPQFDNPNVDPTNADLGKIKAQANLPRNLQLALKLTF